MSQYPLAPEIADYYESKDEGTRLTGPADGRLELIRTQEILRSHIGPAPLDILDIGGATGIHSAWLAAEGHRCTVLDPMPHHVATAREAGLDAVVGDGRDLPFDDASFDVVLVMGPMYHLPEAADRALVLAEAARVVRPGGVVAVAGIGRFASLWENACIGVLAKPSVRDAVTGIITTGKLINPPRGHFTTAFFHTAASLAEELAAAGLRDVVVRSVEGPAWGQLKAVEAQGVRVNETDPLFAAVLEAARMGDGHPELLAAASHLLAVGHRTPDH